MAYLRRCKQLQEVTLVHTHSNHQECTRHSKPLIKIQLIIYFSISNGSMNVYLDFDIIQSIKVCRRNVDYMHPDVAPFL